MLNTQMNISSGPYSLQESAKGVGFPIDYHLNDQFALNGVGDLTQNFKNKNQFFPFSDFSTFGSVLDMFWFYTLQNMVIIQIISLVLQTTIQFNFFWLKKHNVVGNF